MSPQTLCGRSSVLTGGKTSRPRGLDPGTCFALALSYTFTMPLFSFLFTSQMLVGLLASKEATGDRE